MLAFPGDAFGCVCINAPMGERLDDADAAVVGNVIAVRRTELRGAPQLLLTVAIDQRVKGDVEGQIVVRTPRQTDCDVTVPPRGKDIGLLLTEAPDGAWFASACSVVGPAELVAAGGDLRGGAIKVVVGLFILGLVILWAIRRRRRGVRPQLPGPPGSG